MKKVKILLLVVMSLISLNVFAAEVVVQLKFPEPSNQKAHVPLAIPVPQEVSGNLIVDIASYPEHIVKGRYSVEYFLDGQLFYTTDGWQEDNQEQLSFKYVLDSSKFTDGQHKLVINFWDKEGPSAIGIREILINNEE